MKKKVGYIFLILILLLIAAGYSMGNWSDAIYVQTADSGDNELTNELINDFEIRQSFICPYDGLDGIQIKLLRVGKEEIKGYTWRLCDDNGNEIAFGNIGDKELSAKSFVKKKLLNFEIPKQQKSKGKKYLFYINGKGVSKEGCLQAYTTEGNKYAEKFTIDDREKDQALILKFYTQRFNIETFLAFWGLALYVGVFFRFMYKLFK